MREKAGSNWWRVDDWNLPLREIAKVAGVSWSAVQKKRLELGLAPQIFGKRWPHLSRVDWTKPDTEIARELGITRQGAAHHRQRLGAAIPARRLPPEEVDWSEVNWSGKNVDIARRTGANIQLVARKRKRWSNLTVKVGSAR